MQKKSGVIKKYFNDKKYGFIDTGKFDVFFHINGSKSVNEDALVAGAKVEYETEKDQRGKTQAVDLEII